MPAVGRRRPVLSRQRRLSPRGRGAALACPNGPPLINTIAPADRRR
jgi:hypothetical protein